MENVIGGAVGLVTGLIGAFVAAVVQITAKRARNTRLVRRGEPPGKDVVFTPLWQVFAIVGFLAGLACTWQLGAPVVTGVIAGGTLPGLLSLLWLATLLAQLRR